MKGDANNKALTFVPWTPGLCRTYGRMHGANIENAQSTRGGKVVWWLCALVIDEGGRRHWLGLALRGDVSRVVGGRGGVGIWPKLRVVWRSEGGGVRGMPIVGRMIGARVVVVDMQKVVGVHERRELKEGKADETRVGRAGCRPRGT